MVCEKNYTLSFLRLRLFLSLKPLHAQKSRRFHQNIRVGRSSRNCTTETKEVIPVQSLSDEELKRLNALSVADAIRYFSGVQIKDYGGIGGLKTVNVRSMGTNHVGVFYDGIQLGNAQNGQIDLENSHSTISKKYPLQRTKKRNFSTCRFRKFSFNLYAVAHATFQKKQTIQSANR